jgi:hypothetical protein
LHSKQPCCSGEDASSVAKDIARPTLHQIAEWDEQTLEASPITNASRNEITLCSKNIKKTWNFLPCAAVGSFKQLELIAFPLTDKDWVIPEFLQQGNRHGHNSSHHFDPVTDRWFTGLPALQKLGLWPVRYYRRGVGGDTDFVVTRQNMKTRA